MGDKIDSYRAESGRELLKRHCWSVHEMDSLESATMIGKNRRLGTDEPVEFEKLPVEVQDCRKITDHFRGICRIYPPI